MRPVISILSTLGPYNVNFVNELNTINSLIDSANTFTFIDANVQLLHPTLYRETNIVIDCIEDNKTLEKSNDILQKMVELNVKSNSTILIIGGGILQDVVGFCCSVYHRGVTYILIPTTLLAQTDSCIGGKTSINFFKKKNILGTFFPPKEIIIYDGFLNTLADIEYISGLGEIFKFHILQNKMVEFYKVLVKSNIHDTVYDSLLFKKTILDIDEFDKKERKFLNFGHTFGHALEFTSKNAIPHGVAVILGSLVSCYISIEMGYNVPNFELIQTYAKQLLKDISLKSDWFLLENVLEAVKLDKKNTGRIIDVLINGGPVLTTVEDVVIIKHALSNTINLIQDETI